MAHHDHDRSTYGVLIVLFALILVASPFTAWWMSVSAPWYFIYLLWLTIICLTWALARRLRRDATD